MAEKKIPIGRTLKTKDEFLTISPNKQQELKDKRWVAVIDTNKKQECAVVRLTTKKTNNSSELEGYSKGNKKKTYYRHFVETTDNEGKPIKVDGKKFVENEKKYDLTAEQVKKVKTTVYHRTRQSKSNNEKIKKLKGK